MAVEEPLGIGVLGAARISELAIVGPAQAAGCRLVAVGARDRSRAEEFARHHGIERVVGSYADVVADPEVEVVYNPLVNSFHAPWNLAAIAAGKHVLTEKPSARNAGEASEVVDAASSAGVTLLEGFHYLHHPLNKRLHGLLDSGELGELRSVAIDMLMPDPGADDPRWSYDLAGGSMMDLGCYALHAHRMLEPWAGGPPSVVAARAESRPGRPEVDERVDVELDFPGGAGGSVRCDMAAGERRFSCRITGTHGEAIAHNFVQPHIDDRVTVRVGAREWTEELGRRSSYTYQLEALVAHLRHGVALPIGGADAVATMQLIDDTYHAAGLPARGEDAPGASSP